MYKEVFTSSMEMESSPTEFEDGMQSSFWRDISRQLETWLADIRDALEDPDNMLQEKTLYRLGGNAEAIRRILLLPEVTLKDLVDQVKEK